MRSARHPNLRVLAWLAAAILAGESALGQQPIVTSTHRLSNGEVMRKINGRWWTSDNRLADAPGNLKASIQFWHVRSKPGVVEFYHHRPFDVRRAEQLRLFMTTDEIEAFFGKPNSRFAMGSEKGGMWYYHGADGTILQLHFMQYDELGEAEYETVGGDKHPVASIHRELNGRSMYELTSPRATERAEQESARFGSRRPASSTSDRSVAALEIRHASEPVKPVRKRFVAKDSLDSIQTGVTRDDMLAKLGEPTYKSAITSDDGVKETYTYHLDESTPVSISLLNGKVLQVR